MAFTVVELLVSISVMVLAIFAVAQVFDISSETTGRTLAHAELIEASSAVQQRLADQLSKIKPGMLIIESPKPTLARSEIRGGPDLFRLRHDRLVFIAAGEPGEFQSATDPTRGDPDNPDYEPAESSEALVYFGPGVPLANVPPFQPQPFDDESVGLTAAEWVFAHRAILLMMEDPNTTDMWIPPDMSVIAAAGSGMMDGGALYAGFRDGSMDAVVSSASHRATGDVIIELLLGKDPAAELLVANPDIAGLWEPNRTPTTASFANPASADYYTRSSFTFQLRLADFRIEWTDGGVVNRLGIDGLPDTGDEDPRTRWFGLVPYWASLAADPDNIESVALRRQDFGDATAEEQDAFNDEIEWSFPDVSPGALPADLANRDAAYRAIWREDTWRYRPKALRFTYRVYDVGNRLKQLVPVDLDDDGDPDPDGQATAAPVARWGQEFSFVVSLP